MTVEIYLWYPYLVDMRFVLIVFSAFILVIMIAILLDIRDFVRL